MKQTVKLPTGNLLVQVDRSDMPLESITGFAARNNAKRGFLFVSKVLGKHMPVRPSLMRETHHLLARKLIAMRGDLPPAPLLVIGMAETATALGQGFFDALIAQTGLSGAYLATTRYRIGLPCLRFDESHSHAVHQYLHVPQNGRIADTLVRSRTVVLVDDEVSTGNTFVNLVRAVAAAVPAMRELVIVTLLNWLDADTRQSLETRMPCPVSFVSLLEGSFSFTPAVDYAYSAPVRSEATPADRDSTLPLPGGRRGRTPDYRYPVEALAASLHLSPPSAEGPLLILGTGEFMYEPFLLAAHLEHKGYNVFFQATTRSPILVGHDIACSMKFEDNYGESLDNFLYNVNHEKYQRIIICYETETIPEGHTLPLLLNAHVLHFPVPGAAA